MNRRASPSWGGEDKIPAPNDLPKSSNELSKPITIGGVVIYPKDIFPAHNYRIIGFGDGQIVFNTPQLVGMPQESELRTVMLSQARQLIAAEAKKLKYERAVIDIQHFDIGKPKSVLTIGVWFIAAP